MEFRGICWMESRYPCVHLSVCPGFVRMMSSFLLNLYEANMVLWCFLMNPSVLQKDLCADFKVIVTVRVYKNKI